MDPQDDPVAARRRGIYQLEPLQDFVPEVNRRLAQKALAKTDVVVLMCRSGDRSSRGADRLADTRRQGRKGQARNDIIGMGEAGIGEGSDGVGQQHFFS